MKGESMTETTMKYRDWAKKRIIELQAELENIRFGTTSVIQPLPCPFCEEHSIETWVTENEDVDGRAEWISCACTHCGTEGPAMATYKGAIDAWNLRPKVEYKIETKHFCAACSKQLEQIPFDEKI